MALRQCCLPAAFFSYHGFSNKLLKNAGLPRTDQPNSFWFWEKYHFFSVSTFIKSTNCESLHIFIEFYATVHTRIFHDIHNIKVVYCVVIKTIYGHVFFCWYIDTTSGKLATINELFEIVLIQKLHAMQ